MGLALVAGHRAARAAAAAVLGTKGGLTDIDDLTLACGKDNAWSPKTAGAPANAKTAAPNRSPHHTSTVAKPESTTTTTPSDSCFPKTTTSLRYELTAFRFSIQAGIQCVTDLRRAP